MRIRVILFRNYLTDGQYAIQVTDFFDYPAEKEDLCELVNSITVSGNADESEDGLEALAYAMQSDWQAPRLGAKRRQFIALWTDSSSHELGHGRISPFYDPSLPKDLEELTDWWGDDETETSKMDYSSKRLFCLHRRLSPGRCWRAAGITLFCIPPLPVRVCRNMIISK